jgi:hypothetical protein
MISPIILSHLKTLDKKVFKHASNILAKEKRWGSLTKERKDALPKISKKYFAFLTENETLIGFSDEIIKKRTVSLNAYYDFISDNNYDNVFTSQGKFRPTIIEEFMYILFRDLVNSKKEEINDTSNNINIGSSRAYTNLYFSGLNFKGFIEAPKIGINQKDQDFAIFRPIDITIGKSNVIKTNLPIIAIENKTYIDKTMLEGSIATAEKIKAGNPYSMYFIVTENYDVDLKIDPAYSKINQIYVLRKSKRKGVLKPIHADVLIDLVREVENHLSRNWSNVEEKMIHKGKII